MPKHARPAWTKRARMAAMVASFGVLATAIVPLAALPAAAAAGDGYLTIHKESLSEDLDQPFAFTLSGGTAAERQFTLNDYTSVALNVNIGDVAASRDVDGATLWVASMAGQGGPAGQIYRRDAGFSNWVQLPQLTGTKVAGGATASSVFVMDATSVTYWDGSSANALAAPPTCVPSDIASNGSLLLVACTDGTLYKYTGALTGGTPLDWRQIPGAPRAVAVDVNAKNQVITYGGSFAANPPAGGNTVTVFTLAPGDVISNPTPHTRTGAVDVAVSPDSTYYVTAGAVQSSSDGQNWVNEPQSRNSRQITASTAGRLWASNPRGVSGDPLALGTTILSRAADGSYYDDERIRTTGGSGNTVHMAVTPGAQTISEASVPGWILQQVSCFDSTTNQLVPKQPTITNGTVSVDVAAGQFVSCTFLNVYSAQSTIVSSGCYSPYVDTFGTGEPGTIASLPSGRTSYHTNTTAVGNTNDGYYGLVTRATDGGYWSPANFGDRSGTPNGRFLYFNASYNPGIFYQERFTQAVIDTPYTFSTYIADMAPTFGIRPNVRLQVVDPATGRVLEHEDTGNITQATPQWQKYSFTFVPTQSEFLLQLVNTAVGGGGNDLGIDDVTFGISCSPVTLTKELDSSRPADTDQYRLELRGGSPTGTLLSASTTTGGGSTVANGSVTNLVPIDTTVYLIEAPSGTTNPDNYLPSRITCTDPSGGTTGLPTNQVYTGPIAITPGDGADIRCTLTNIPKKPSLSIVKTALEPRSFAHVDDPIDYEFLVTNTGNEPLSNVTVKDTQVEPALDAQLSAIDCPATTLAVGANMTCTATYEVTQADIDHGSVKDIAHAEGTPSNRTTPVLSNVDDETVYAVQTPKITIVKSTTATAVANAGTTVPYSFLVTNAGNVTLKDVSVADMQKAPAVQENLSDIVCGRSSNAADAAGALSPAATMTCTATYETTQADIDNGSITDVATATGTPPTGEPITSDPSQVVVPVTAGPALSVVKSTTTTVVSHVGDEVTYTFVATNTGNVTLTNVRIADVVAAPSTQENLSALECSTPTTLAPRDTLTCTATYTVTQADLDNGSITDAATATGTPPQGDDVTTPPSTVTVPAQQVPAVTVVKSADKAEVSAVGEKIAYTFVVTNTGNVTLTDVGVTDQQIAPALAAHLTEITCGASTVESDAAGAFSPGAHLTCEATYTVAQADLDHGTVTDTAIAHGTPPGTTTPVTSDPSTVVVSVRHTPTLPVTGSAPVWSLFGYASMLLAAGALILIARRRAAREQA